MQVTRLVLCTGKVCGRSRRRARSRAETKNVAIARVEQLAPFPKTALGMILARYPNLREIVWLQEEPQNMGAWALHGDRAARTDRRTARR